MFHINLEKLYHINGKEYGIKGDLKPIGKKIIPILLMKYDVFRNTSTIYFHFFCSCNLFCILLQSLFRPSSTLAIVLVYLQINLYHLHSLTNVQMLLCEVNIYIYSNGLSCMLPIKYSLYFSHELLHLKHVTYC